MSKLSLQRTVGLALELEAVIGNADHVGSPMPFANEARAGFDLGPWRRQGLVRGLCRLPAARSGSLRDGFALVVTDLHRRSLRVLPETLCPCGRSRPARYLLVSSGRRRAAQLPSLGRARRVWARRRVYESVIMARDEESTTLARQDDAARPTQPTAEFGVAANLRSRRRGKERSQSVRHRAKPLRCCASHSLHWIFAR